MKSTTSDKWTRGDAYERCMGRLSRQLAPRFLDGVGAPPGQRWLDVGGGAGASGARLRPARCP